MFLASSTRGSKFVELEKVALFFDVLVPGEIIASDLIVASCLCDVVEKGSSSIDFLFQDDLNVQVSSMVEFTAFFTDADVLDVVDAELVLDMLENAFLRSIGPGSDGKGSRVETHAFVCRGRRLRLIDLGRRSFEIEATFAGNGRSIEMTIGSVWTMMMSDDTGLNQWLHRCLWLFVSIGRCIDGQIQLTEHELSGGVPMGLLSEDRLTKTLEFVLTSPIECAIESFVLLVLSMSIDIGGSRLRMTMLEGGRTRHRHLGRM